MSNPTTGEWTAKLTSHGWYVEFDTMNGACIDNELTAKVIANAHETQIQQLREQLAEEREKNSFSRLHVDLAEIKVKLDAAVEALKIASDDLECPSANETHYCPNCDNSLYNAKAKIDAALAKIGGTK